MEKLPSHLKRYIVEQDYSRYTAVDQAVWRFIMRRLKNYLSKHAHESYVDGLRRTGISTESIPKISEMSEKLAAYGWRACAVSGFIPPAAFMELQSLGVLPIACDMRTIEHAMYTPAPDIVHEAAGHAPILINPEFANYLREYAQVAKKAIIDLEDLNIYSAIRHLSDLKENPNATEDEILQANRDLQKATAAAQEPSEAALLARMNWWTAEYGLIGTIEKPKIYGAGLLSSVGESYTALQGETKKIAFSLKCLDFSYDITEPQPQLFVTPSFRVLTEALHEMANTMSFKQGGVFGLNRAKKSRTVNTVELDSGIQISGLLKEFSTHEGVPTYLQFEGPTQLSYENKVVEGQDTTYHSEGFGSPVGMLKGTTKKLSEYTDTELSRTMFEFESGVLVAGKLKNVTRIKSKALIITFADCTVTNKGVVVFKPEWGNYDMVVGATVASVFGGAADREAYGSTDDFESKRVPERKHSPEFLALDEIFKRIRKMRETQYTESEVGIIIDRLNKDFPKDWLAKLEVYELCRKKKLKPSGYDKLTHVLTTLAGQNTSEGMGVRDGLKLIEKEL